jgi:ABC-type uncharacterized transport system permease subunit
MDYKLLLNGIRYILLNPIKAWSIIYEENRSLGEVRNSFLFPLIILASLCAFLGSIIFTNTTLSHLYSVFVGLKYLILYLFVIYTSAIVFGEITKALDLEKNFTLSFKMMTYSLAPFMICQFVSHIFESLIFVNILSLYGLYIFWVGAERMFNPPEYKKMPMLVATFIVVIGLYIAGDIVLTAIIDRIYFAVFA